MKHDKKDIIDISKLTDEQWQVILEQMRKNTIPSVNKRMKLVESSNRISGFHSFYLTDSSNANGRTQYRTYLLFINSVLKTIRKKNRNVDYCYYAYQIKDLLKFEPTLQATLVHDPSGMDYFVVHL